MLENGSLWIFISFILKLVKIAQSSSTTRGAMLDKSCCDSIIIWMCVIASPLLCTALILLSGFDLNRFYGIKLLLLTVPFNRTNTKDVYVCFSTLEWDNFVLRDSKYSKICIDIWSQNLLKNILGLLKLICYVFF